MNRKNESNNEKIVTMNQTVTVKSENGSHSLEISDEYCRDMLEAWGIDMRKFAGEYLTALQQSEKPGKWTVAVKNCVNDDNAEYAVKFVFSRILDA